MKRFVAGMLLALLTAFFAHAASETVKIGPLPLISNTSPQLRKSLDALKARIESDVMDCIETAKGMDSAGQYDVVFKKMIDTNKVVVLQVSGSMMCDGVHSSSYQYGIAFEKKSGKRLDLNLIYNIATRQDGRLFLRDELIDSAKSSYAKANESDRSCLSDGDWKGALSSIPITFAPQSDGAVLLYYAAPDVSAACFPPLRLSPEVISKFRDVAQAAQYGLP